MGKRVMVLGAGIFQVPLIHEANEMGFETIAVSNRSSDPGLVVAQKAYLESTADNESVLRIAKKERIDAVVTCASETAMPTVGFVNSEMGLRGPGYEEALTVANKVRLRELLSSESVRIPRYSASVITMDRQRKWMQKPVEGGGSRDVNVANENLDQREFIEEFVSGQELGGDLIVKNGGIVFLQTTQKEVNQHWVPVQHLLTFGVDQPIRLRSYLSEVVRALGVEEGIFNFDVIHDGRDYWLIDLGMRIGGNCIPDLIRYQTGVNEYRILLQQAVGESYTIMPKWSGQYYGVQIFGATENCFLTGYNEEEIESLKRTNQYVAHHFRYKSGDEISAFTTGGHLAGYVVFRAPSIDKLGEVARNIAATPWIRFQTKK